MALFDTGVQSNRVATSIMVELALGELGYEPRPARSQQAGASHAWRIANGSAIVRIHIQDGENFANMRLESTLMTVTADTDLTGLYPHLLSLNCKALLGCAFAIDGDRVLLVAERPTLDLDQSEVSGMLRTMLAYADEYDDKLVDQFGGKLGE